MDASNWGAGAQLLYVKLAIKRGDWRDLARRGAEPTPTMKLLFLKGRERYVAWRARCDAEEDAEPKEWIEVTPGHWVRGKLIDVTSIEEVHERQIREVPEIDTSKTCPRCKLRRVEPNRSLCGNCIEIGYTQ